MKVYLLNMVVFSKAYKLFSLIFYFIFEQIYYLGTFWIIFFWNWFFRWNVLLFQRLTSSLWTFTVPSATRLIYPKHTTFHISTDNEDKNLHFFLSDYVLLANLLEAQNAFWLQRQYNPTMIFGAPNLSFCVSKFLRQWLAVGTQRPQSYIVSWPVIQRVMSSKNQ